MNTNKRYLLFMSAAIMLWGCNGKTIAVKGDTAAISKPIPCACAGKLQSPINIVERSAIVTPLPPLAFIGNATQMSIQNDKKAIKVSPTDTLDSTNFVMFNRQKYILVDFHFHHKSEHLFNGVRDSLEMHVVFKSRKTGAIVVAGLLIGMGDTPNAVLSTIWRDFPDTGDYAPKKLKVLVNVAELIRYNAADIYYQYVGSLTTPEYEEGVAWLVFKKKLVLTHAQIAMFGLYYKNNSRDTLAINNRLIFTNRR